MDDKKFESPEEVRAFLNSDAFADGFKKWLVTSKALFGDVPAAVEFGRVAALFAEVSQHLGPLVLGWQHLMKTAAPIVLEVWPEFVKWNVSSEVLGRAGWLPHYTTPFGYIAECGKDIEAVRGRLLDYYTSSWQNVRSEIESRLSDYKIDAEAKATFDEALDAHEAGLYRCVCRVLFPEIERVVRAKLFNNKVGSITFNKLIEKLVSAVGTVAHRDNPKFIDDFIPGGLYELYIFGHLTKALREEDASESDKFIYGLFQSVLGEEDRERLKQDPVPNRHAAIHGLVVYSSPQNSLNTIFIADYIFRIVAPAMPLPTPRQ